MNAFACGLKSAVTIRTGEAPQIKGAFGRCLNFHTDRRAAVSGSARMYPMTACTQNFLSCPR